MNLHRYRAPYLGQPRHALENSYRMLARQLARDHAREPIGSESELILRETHQDLRAHLDIPPEARALVILDRPSGLFSLVLIVLSYLALAEKRHLAIQVHFGPRCLYAAPDASPDDNAWAHFFEPLPFPAALPARATLEKYCDTDSPLPGSHIYVTRRPPALILSPGRIDEHNRNHLSALLRRHIRPLPHIRKIVETFAARHEFSRCPVIGVHVRGNEHDAELGYFRLARRPLSDTHAAIARQLSRLPEARIFLATDQAAIIGAFRARYGERLITFDAQRAAAPGASLHLHKGGPQIGAEVLIETLLLSRTAHLVHGISNVSSAACYFNPSLPHTGIYEQHRLASRLAYELRGLRARTRHNLRLLKLRLAR